MSAGISKAVLASALPSALALATIAFFASGWWMPGLAAFLLGTLASFWVRRVVVNERISEALAAEAEYDSDERGESASEPPEG